MDIANYIRNTKFLTMSYKHKFKHKNKCIVECRGFIIRLTLYYH